jgi:hypothetical protein
LINCQHRISRVYFAALKIGLVRGRMWSVAENARGAGVAVINQAMARAVWADRDPLGQRFHVPALSRSTSQFVLAAPGADGSFEVVGIVRDTPNAGLHERPEPAFFVPYTGMLGDGATLCLDSAPARSDWHPSVCTARWRTRWV